MNTETQDGKTQCERRYERDAIAAVDGQHSIRQRLRLTHRLYDAMLLMQPEERARRPRLIDAVFIPPAPT